MKPYLSRQRIAVVTLLLGAVIALLLADAPAVHAADAGSRIPENPSSLPTEGVARGASFQLPPLAAYVEIVQRPLFSSDRRVQELPQAAPARPEPFALRGIVVGMGERHAIIEEGSVIKRLIEGQALGGGTIKAITRDKLVLELNGMSTTVNLFDQEANDRPSRPRSASPGILSQAPLAFPTGPALPPQPDW